MRPLRTAEIIAVGTELLPPFRSDTNSLGLTTHLNDLGIVLAGKLVAGDEVDGLAAALHLALARCDLVVTTGGLGPTEDDVTREGGARAHPRARRDRACGHRSPLRPTRYRDAGQ